MGSLILIWEDGGIQIFPRILGFQQVGKFLHLQIDGTAGHDVIFCPPIGVRMWWFELENYPAIEQLCAASSRVAKVKDHGAAARELFKKLSFELSLRDFPLGTHYPEVESQEDEAEEDGEGDFVVELSNSPSPLSRFAWHVVISRSDGTLALYPWSENPVYNNEGVIVRTEHEGDNTFSLEDVEYCVWTSGDDDLMDITHWVGNVAQQLFDIGEFEVDIESQSKLTAFIQRFNNDFSARNTLV